VWGEGGEKGGEGGGGGGRERERERESNFSSELTFETLEREGLY